jgi:hypothetical protein
VPLSLSDDQGDRLIRLIIAGPHACSKSEFSMARCLYERPGLARKGSGAVGVAEIPLIESEPDSPGTTAPITSGPSPGTACWAPGLKQDVRDVRLRLSSNACGEVV